MSNGLRYADRVAWVSGGASGLGEACCIRLASEGAHVVVADIDERAAQSTASALRGAGFEAISMRCDVADPGSVEHVIKATCDKFGRLDLAVNNAGIAGALTDIVQYPIEMWNKVIAVNLN